MTDPLAGIVRAWLARAAEDVIAQAASLTELDARIGDGDHGINLQRGMRGVVEWLEASEADVGSADLLKHSGRLMISLVGGASGPLYGTFFLDAGAALERGASGPDDLARALERGVVGVARRGRSQAGQKTMLDTLIPASSSFAIAVRAGAEPQAAGRAAAAAARSGRDSTHGMIAQRGRASYLGERARDHLDPGAASALIVIEALADALRDQPVTSTAAGASR